LECSSAAPDLPPWRAWRQGPAIGVAAGVSWRCFVTLDIGAVRTVFLFLQPIQELSDLETINETFAQD
jgi:hypothetical protein